MIGDTDAVMESPLSLDEETLDDNFEQDTVFENESNGDILLNKKHLSNGTDISEHKREETEQFAADLKEKGNGKYFDISKFSEGHVIFLLICTFIRYASYHL